MRSELILILLITSVYTWCPDHSLVVRGTGYMDRYWDCCKEFCSWEENAYPELPSRSCDRNGYILDDLGMRSSCEGGGAYICPSHAPFSDPECKNLAYAFASVPEFLEFKCGKCYLLRFLGEGYYETRKAHQLIEGKFLFIKTVGRMERQKEQQQIEFLPWDVLIPGGGSRKLNGCRDLFKDQGDPYGGLLTDCENEVGYGYDEETIYMRRKDCLIEKCKRIFPSGSDEEKGCLFLAEYLEGASYPLFEWGEIECPPELNDRYGAKF